MASIAKVDLDEVVMARFAILLRWRMRPAPTKQQDSRREVWAKLWADISDRVGEFGRATQTQDIP
eukprot:5339711-Pyramimonas_sp.AAC.1